MKCVGVILAVMCLATGSIAGRPVGDRDDFERAIRESCQGKAVGAQCTVEFEGGSVTVGVCVYLNPNSPADGEIICKLNVDDIKKGCKNDALGTPSAAITYGGLLALLGLFSFRRRKKA